MRHLEVFGDSLLIICQTPVKWLTKDEKEVPYHVYLEELIKKFERIKFTYLSRTKNQFADALATLASMVEIPEGVKMRPIEVEQRDEPRWYCNQIREEKEKDNIGCSA